MSLVVELGTLESEFADAWNDLTPIEFENDGTFKPPANQASYVRFVLLQGDSQLMGGRGNGVGRYRHFGVIQIDCYAREGNGTKAALSLADSACAIFREKRISDVLCRTPRISKPAGYGGYYRVTVSIEYQRDEFF
jgi:hypothetical protein